MKLRDIFLTAGLSLISSGIISAADFTITIPQGASIELGTKSKHFVDFTKVEPVSSETTSEGVCYKYNLTNSQVYNYRVWKTDGLTHAGYFTMSTTEANCPVIKITEEDLKSHNPKEYNHEPSSNSGYETGDIFVNINPQGHLYLENGKTFMAHAMRTWELTDNSVNNYFIEPDFHYTVTDIDGQSPSDVIEIETGATSAWAKITAKKEGEALVRVTYDGINLNYYKQAVKTEYLGGEYWGAIWPENTAVYVVTVGSQKSDAIANIRINETYNEDTKKLAGDYVDAEHDVFYYLDSEPGFYYTFKPENVTEVAIAYPSITTSETTYSGFNSNGISKNDDGSYTVLLKEGRQIVRLTGNNGIAAYQVLTAKPCTRLITNLTNPERKNFQPGDQIQIQYSGLYHPANKIAGIYNMSAYVTYNGTPNGSSLILGSGQYTFGSSPSAQCVVTSIPIDYDVSKNPKWIMNDGVIQVTGFGDPIGNHRNTIYNEGRSANLNATSHQTYFGSIPDIEIDVVDFQKFDIILKTDIEADNVELKLNKSGQTVNLTPDMNGVYSGPAGVYTLTAFKDGYRATRNEYIVPEDAEGQQVFIYTMEKGLPGMWDGQTIADNVYQDENNVYHIKTGAELAYLSQAVAQYGKNFTSTIVLDNDIDLGNFEWTRIGDSSNYFAGVFDGQDHSVTGLYVNTPDDDYAALFGYIRGTSSQSAVIKNLTVDGRITGGDYTAGIVGRMYSYSTVDKCANLADITGKDNVGGVAGYMQSNAQCIVSNSYNKGNITANSKTGGVVGYNGANAVIEKIYNTGMVSGTAEDSTGPCVGGTTSKTNVTDAFSIFKTSLDDNSITVTTEQMASGEVAYKLGDAFFQTLGVDPSPVFNGANVYYDVENDSYYNIADAISIGLGEGDENTIISTEGVVIEEKASYQLVVVADPIQGRYPDVSWSSSDPETLTVDSNGLIKGINKGTATVSVSTVINEEPFVASCKVEVVPTKVKSLMLDNSSLYMHLTDYPIAILSASYSPGHADTPKLVWSSDNEAVVSVSPNDDLSATVTALDKGSATIKVEHADNPAIYDTCNIYVSDATDIETISMLDINSPVTIFNVNGLLISTDFTISDINSLPTGVYILAQGEKKIKLYIP